MPQFVQQHQGEEGHRHGQAIQRARSTTKVESAPNQNQKEGEMYLEEKGYLSAKKMEKARGFFDMYGGWTLLLSWVPIIGDPLTFIEGVLKYRFWWFVVIVAVAKATRYAVIILMVTQ